MEGALPVAWRVANVTPIFKKGSRLDPVSLTSVVCKVAEKCFCVQCSNFLNSNSLLSPHQHGFVTGKACVTNLLEMGDIISRGVAKRRWMDMVLLDFAKAFDTVSHPRLLHKLAAYDIIGANLRWIRAFLTDRQQRVVMGDTTSNWVSVTSGVPQGSVLGPFLFVVYINDMPDNISNHIKLYADDTKLAADVGPPTPSCHTTPPSSSNRLQLDVDRASQWSDTWLLRLHPDKSIVIHFGRGNPCGRTLKSSGLERDLGVMISSDLKSHEQAVRASAKAMKMLGLLRSTFVSRSTSIWLTLYTTYVRPHLEFAVPAWRPHHERDIDVIERVQRRATRLMHEIRGLDYPDRCKYLGIEQLEDRRERGDLIQMYKLVNGLDKVQWQAPLQWRPPRGGHRSKLAREIVKGCDARHHFFTNRIANTWNQLPDSVVSAPTVNSF